MFAGLLRRTHLTAPSDLADVVAEEAEAWLGARDVVLFLVNREESALVAVPAQRSPKREQQLVEASMAGRSYSTSTILTAAADTVTGQGNGQDDNQGDGGGVRWRRVWLPLLDGTDRLGTLEMTLPTISGVIEHEVIATAERYAHLAAQSVLSKRAYGDVFDLVQRSRPLSVATELMNSMLPPLTYATTGLVLSAMLEPTYDNGGDAFDYALNDGVLHLAVFDGMGHGLAAAGLTSFALAAYRNARRRGLGLADTYAAIDAAVLGQFGGDRHITAVLAQLELDSGQLRWLSAGHPPLLLLREGSVVKVLQARSSYPMGWPFHADATQAAASVEVAEEVLQPGDMVLLYTDGLIEARRPDGAFLGLNGLSGFIEAQAAAAQPAPETLRRLRRAILMHQNQQLQDDVTALLVEWNRGSEHQLMPQTVE